MLERAPHHRITQRIVGVDSRVDLGSMRPNPWHDVELGEHIERHFRLRHRDPEGLKVKYELDRDGTALARQGVALGRPLSGPITASFPRPSCEDDDPLDVLVLGQEPVVPLCVLRARPSGHPMTDDKGRDDKVIAAHVDIRVRPLPRHLRAAAAPPSRRSSGSFWTTRWLEDKMVDIDHIRTRGCRERRPRRRAPLSERILPTLGKR